MGQQATVSFGVAWQRKVCEWLVQLQEGHMCTEQSAVALAGLPVARSKAVLWAGHTMHLLDTWPCRM
jgi:hypothetical protein